MGPGVLEWERKGRGSTSPTLGQKLPRVDRVLDVGPFSRPLSNKFFI